MISTWILALFVASVSAGSIERHRRQLGADCQLANWQAHGGNEYAFFDHIKSFTAAEGICMRCHATVASIGSQEEMTFVRSLVPDSKPFWLGATDRDAEGQFVWLDGSPMSYTNWKRGEPDNLSTDEANEADCAYVNQHGLWRDNHCDLDSKRFVCKRSGAAVTTASPQVTTTPAMLNTKAVTTPMMATTVPTTMAKTMPPTPVALAAAPAVETVDKDEVESRVHIMPAFVTDRPSQPEVSQAPENDYQRTVVLMQKSTRPGEYVFFRGGVDHSLREGCTTDADTSECAIPMEVRHENLNISAAYDAWRAGDDHLDWYGKEEGQGVFNNWQPQGSPGLWTTNDVTDKRRFHPLNTFGPHYWMLDMDMDCSRTVDGYFEVKAYMSDARAWEHDITNNQCQGAEAFPFTSTNHIAKCGALNVFHYDEGRCEIRDL